MTNKEYGMISKIYRVRWPLAIGLLVAVGAFFLGGMQQMTAFSGQVDALKVVPPKEAPPPRMFDARYDIWFDPADSGLRTYKDVEDRFVAEDTLVVAFEDPDDPMGAFGPKALESVARMTAAIEKVPYVRNVRSLTSNPWIRWGQAGPDEEGLIVTDLFEEKIQNYSEGQRLERMVAVLGAERAASLVGSEKVTELLGDGESFANHIGEPRLIDSVVSPDGRTTALLVQVLRTKVPDTRLQEVFGDGKLTQKAVGPAIITNESQWGALARIEQIASQEKFQVHIAGMPALERNFMVVGMQDMAYVGLMFLLIGVVLLFVYRKISGVALPLLIVFASIMGMMGIVWLKGDLLNNLTAMAPNMMTAVGIADSVHLITIYYLLRPQFKDKETLIMEVMKRNWLPVLLTSITTAVGFFSLMTSEIVPMRMLGYTGGIGTMFAYLLSMTVVPALLSLIPLKEQKQPAVSSVDDEEGPHWSDGLTRWVTKYRVPIAATSAAILGISILGLSRVEVSSDFREMFPEDDKMISDMRWIEDKLGGTGDLELIFFGPQLGENDTVVNARQARIEQLEIARLEGRLNSPAEQEELQKLKGEERAYQQKRVASSHAFLDQIDRFQRRVEKESQNSSSPLRVLTSFDSAVTVLRKMHQVQNKNRADFYRIPTPKDVPAEAQAASIEYDDILEEAVLIPAQNASSMASQYYLQFENGAKPSENLSSLITADRRGFRITARVTSAPAPVHQAAYARLREIVREDFPDMAAEGVVKPGTKTLAGMTMTGKHYLFTNMVQRFSYTLISSLSLALVVITLLISLIYRSVTLGVLSLVPNVLPLVVPLGIMGLIGMPLDGPAVLVCTVALGVCVDDSIHFLTKFTHALDDGLNVLAALRRAFRQVGSALTWTTVVLMLGFGVLTLSSFRPNMMIGYLGVIMIGLAWVADFLILPALLSFTHARAGKRVPDYEPALSSIS